MEDNYSFIEYLEEAGLLDNVGYSIHKALAKVLQITTEQAKKLLANTGVGVELGLIDLLEQDNPKKEEIIEYLEDHGVYYDKILGLRTKEVVEGINTKKYKKKNGDSKMAKKDLNEGVLGLTNVPGLKRMLELAGRKDIKEDEADYNDQEPTNFDFEDDVFDFNSETGVDFSTNQTSSAMDSIEPSEPVNVEPVQTTEPVVKDAYSDIQDHLNAIQTRILDIRLSEFKPLLSQVEALLSDLRERGKEALREHQEMLNKKKSKRVQK